MIVDNSRLLLILMYEKYLRNLQLHTTEASEKLEISKPAITEICKKLKLNNYINYEPYKAFEFTNSGLILAKKIFYRLCIVEKYLFAEFKIAPYRARNEAVKIEPVMSDFLIDKIKLKTPFPDISLFGININNFSRKISKLANCSVDNTVVPVAISEGVIHDEGEFWAEIAFLIGKYIYVKNINTSIDAITVIVENSTRNISLKIAQKVMVIEYSQSNSQN